MPMSPDLAETTGLQALGWLVANEELLPVFLGASGATLEMLKTGAADPAFLGSVLEFLMMDDAWVIDFCAEHGYSNDSPMQARQMLPGGEQVNWT